MEKYILTVSVVMFIISLILIILSIRKKSNKQLPKQLIPINTFETDIVFLHFLMEKELSHVEGLLLPLSKKYISAVIRDELLEEYEAQVSHLVYSSLSENYKANLMKYFTDESLMDYITRTISRRLLTKCFELNIGVE